MDEYWDNRFNDLAGEQRGEPEGAMHRIQEVSVSNLYGSLAEHVGDLIHRMAQRPLFFKGGYEWVREKVDKTLRWLTNPYGFLREVVEQSVSHYGYHKREGNLPAWFTSPEVGMAHLRKLGQRYADEHRKLKPFNAVQRMARSAAIAVGEFRFRDAIERLRNLKYVLDRGSKAWSEEAMKAPSRMAPSTSSNPRSTGHMKTERDWWEWAKKDLQYYAPELLSDRIERIARTYNWYKPPEQVIAMLWALTTGSKKNAPGKTASPRREKRPYITVVHSGMDPDYKMETFKATVYVRGPAKKWRRSFQTWEYYSLDQLIGEVARDAKHHGFVPATGFPDFLWNKGPMARRLIGRG
jgi:hypothetical protein